MLSLEKMFPSRNGKSDVNKLHRNECYVNHVQPMLKDSFLLQLTVQNNIAGIKAKYFTLNLELALIYQQTVLKFWAVQAKDRYYRKQKFNFIEFL